jgi:hypothetical protein
MTDTVSKGQRLADALKDLVKDMGTRLAGDWIKDGYDSAAHVSTGLLAHRIEELHDKNRSGKRLTQQEQYLLTTLTDIKSDMERELQDAWDKYVRP